MSAAPIKISKNIEKVARTLFNDSEEQRRFLDAVARGESGVTGVVWLRESQERNVFTTNERPEWMPEWIDVAQAGERPGKLKAHDDGDIYCMDLSSTFACAALSAIPDTVGVIVDVCASPGGKGIVASRYLSPSLLVGNEVIGKRTAPLISNYKRCKIAPSIVTSLDPEVLGKAIPECAQLVIVDAPCSGQSLVLKGMAASGAFHPATIGMNERRQRRILAHSSKLVAPGGYLLYATCTFSREENENNVEWFLKHFPDFAPVSVETLDPYRSRLSEQVCYRLLPQSGKGAGAFCALLKRVSDGDAQQWSSPDAVTTSLRAVWNSHAVSPTREKDTPGAHRSRKHNGRRSERYERQKVKRTLRGYES